MFVVIVWGLNFVAIKYAFQEWDVKAIATLRYLLMLPLMFWMAAVLKQTVKLSKGEHLKHYLAGFMSSGLYMVFFLEGMDRVGAAQGAVCLATAPLWVSLFAVVTKIEKFRWTLVFGGLLSYLGVATVILAGTGERHWTPLGLALVLISAMIWAWSIIMMRPLLIDRPALGVFTATFPGAAIIMVPYGVIPMIQTDFSAITWIGWSALAYLVVLAGAGAFASYYIGIKAVGPQQASMTQYFVPIVAALGAWGLRGEPMNLIQGLGVFGVLLGVWWAKQGALPPNPDPEVAT